MTVALASPPVHPANMSYTVLARRYRSQSFDEVVGQQAVARTLQRAIEQDRVAHAYLFVGTRGVGKTTMARLLAKALNAGTGEVADAVMAGHDTDVIEIDAASNRGVEEARDLIANCIYRPMRGLYKIYIIDEVHMLTREAFNALLKTMEEPPAHVKFVLCTTEPHKVPPTIQSRCQRFDFRPISTADIAGHLTHVLELERVTAEPELVRTVARLASGSMRDSLSLLDRVIAAAEPGEPLTLELLERLLGLPERDLLDALFEAFADQSPAGALERADELLSRGVSLDQIIDSVVAVARDLMVLSTCGVGTDLVDLAGESRERAAALAKRFTPAGLVHMIALCESIARATKTSANPRALFDALVVRLAMTEQIADAAALLKNSGAGATNSGTRAANSGTGASPVRTAGSPQKKSDPEPAARTLTQAADSAAPDAGAAQAAPTADDPWSRFCSVAAKRPTTRVLAQTLRLQSIDSDRAVLTADNPKMLANARHQTDLLASMFREALGRPVRIEFAGDSDAPAASPAPNRLNDPVLEHDLVRKAVELFDARVVSIEDDDTPPSDG